MAENSKLESKSPAQRVFAIPELAEMILLYLPIRQVLHAERINKACEATIKSSSKLQQALFLKPSPMHSFNAQPWCGDPTCAVPCQKAGLEDKNNASGDVLKSLSNQCILILRNPFINYHAYDYVRHGSKPGDPNLAVESTWRKNALCRPEASWRRMYITQPAIEFMSGLSTLGELDENVVEDQKWLFERSTDQGSLEVDCADDVASLLCGTLKYYSSPESRE